MFGINIPIKDIRANKSSVEEEVNATLKRNDERKVFNQFLDSELLSGEKVVDKIRKSVKEETDKFISEGLEIPRQTLLDFAVSRLKTGIDGRLNIYDSLVRKIVENQHPEFIKLHNLIDGGKFDGKLPFGYPDASKNAQGILAGKIKDSLPKIEREYLEQKLTVEKVRELAREMFYGINKLNLQKDQLSRYLSILFELSQMETNSAENPSAFKFKLSEGLKDNLPINLLFIKCLRFTYPEGKRLKLITHTGEAVIPNRFGGIRHKYDETSLFFNLAHLEQIFKKNGVSVSSVVVIANNDLSDNFPVGFGDVIPAEDIKRAGKDAEVYMNSLKSESGGRNIVKLTDLLNGKMSDYQTIRNKILKDLKGGYPRFISEAALEEMVNNRFERDSAIFAAANRDLARERVYQKIASMFALKVLKTESAVFLTNSHGNENRIIAGGEIPTLFMNLFEGE